MSDDSTREPIKPMVKPMFGELPKQQSGGRTTPVRGKYMDVLESVMERPGEWACVVMGLTRARAYGCTANLKARRAQVPDGAWDFRTRANEGAEDPQPEDHVWDVWALYHGEAEADDA